MRTHKTYFRLLAVLLAGIMLLLSGCAGSEVNTAQNSPDYVESEDFQNFLDPLSAFAKAPNGYYFLNGLLLYFFDPQAEKAYVACSNPNCDHTTSECMAFFNIFQFYPFQLAYYQNTLYVLGWEEDGSVRHNYLYSVSLDDYKRKKAVYLFDGTDRTSVSFIVHRGYVYFTWGGADLKEQTACLYRAKLGETSTKKEPESVFEFSGIGAWISSQMQAVGNRVVLRCSSYGDTQGNDQTTSYVLLDIHTLESQKLALPGNIHSFFVDENYAYYLNGENIVQRLDLTTNEETLFCEVDGPCYISTDSRYLYFDNRQSISVGILGEAQRKISVYDKDGNHVTDVVPKNPNDECYFGGDDFMFFNVHIPGTSKSAEETKNAKDYYALDKSQLTSADKTFVTMEE